MVNRRSMQSTEGIVVNNCCSGGVNDAVTSPTPSMSVDDVFNDIDNMFQGLAQELDEMLTLQDM